MLIKKTLTGKQLEANRNNSLSSTGPKSTRGKKVSSKNAMRHGLLSEEIVTGTGDGLEDGREFSALLEALRLDYSPSNTLESLLVERIAWCFWRLRRAARCEAGETRKSLRFPELICRRRLEESIVILKTAINQVESLGKVPEQVEDDLYRIFGKKPEDVDYLFASLNPERKKIERGELAGSEQDDCAQRRLIDFLNSHLNVFMDEFNGKENLDALQADLDAELQSRILPSELSLDRVLRYETAVERQLYRALDQLERVRRQRMGDAVPPPIKLNVDHS